MSSSDRLTRQELSWLLTQEARRAAQTLRKGVAALSQPPAEPHGDPAAPPADIVHSLATLEDAMKALASINVNVGARGVRGSIDLAALVCELAPNARLRIAPGSGTEVFGEESELRRMIQIMLAQIGGSHGVAGQDAPEVRIGREGDDVRVSVALGPDTLASGSSEHAWLSRMALRYGGRMTLDGGQQSLILPAQGASDRKEIESLRKELEAAQQQGEAYARELAAVFATGDTGAQPSGAPSTIPPPATSLAPLASMASAIAAQLRPLVYPTTREGEPAPPIAEGTVALQLNELLSDLQRLAKVPLDELPTHLDVAALVRAVVEDADARATRHGVSIQFDVTGPVHAFVWPGAFRAVVRFLIDHAISATPRDHRIVVLLAATDRKLKVIVDDDGTAVPAGSRDALVWRRIDPGSIGRPGGIHLLAASTVVAHLHGSLDVEDSPDLGARTVATLPLP